MTYNGGECKNGCNCVEVAMFKNGGEGVKSYRCLKPLEDVDNLKSTYIDLRPHATSPYESGLKNFEERLHPQKPIAPIPNQILEYTINHNGVFIGKFVNFPDVIVQGQSLENMQRRGKILLQMYLTFMQEALSNGIETKHVDNVFPPKELFMGEIFKIGGKEYIISGDNRGNNIGLCCLDDLPGRQLIDMNSNDSKGV